jgi:hypothetical protein
MSDGLFIPVDLNQVNDDFTPMPEGVYKMQVEKLEAKKSKADNNMVNVTMNVLEPTEYLGRKGFTNLVLIPAAMWKVKQFVKACGVSFDTGGFNLADAIGKSVLVKVTQEQYTDKEGVTKVRNVFDEYMAEG